MVSCDRPANGRLVIPASHAKALEDLTRVLNDAYAARLTGEVDARLKLVNGGLRGVEFYFVSRVKEGIG